MLPFFFLKQKNYFLIQIPFGNFYLSFMHAIAQMNERLTKLSSVFSQTTQHFAYSINLHQGKFTKQDFEDFDNLIGQIKSEVNKKITCFFQGKLQQNSQIYENKIEKYTENAQELQCELFSFRTQLEKHTIALKEQEQRNEVILDQFSQKFYLNCLKKKYFLGFKKNVQICKQEEHINSQAAKIYRKNLIKKVFFPWRGLTYKDGHENNILQQTQNDIQNIHTQYTSIISILKQKIRDTEELTKIKKAAKNQFAYALSKNLMKTISNLSLEVMSLNQVSLKDEECERDSQNQRFMREVDKIVDQKFKQVNEFKENLLGERSERGERQKKIRFT